MFAYPHGLALWRSCPIKFSAISTASRYTSSLFFVGIDLKISLLIAYAGIACNVSLLVIFCSREACRCVSFSFLHLLHCSDCSCHVRFTCVERKLPLRCMRWIRNLLFLGVSTFWYCSSRGNCFDMCRSYLSLDFIVACCEHRFYSSPTSNREFGTTNAISASTRRLVWYSICFLQSSHSHIPKNGWRMIEGTFV